MREEIGSYLQKRLEKSVTLVTSGALMCQGLKDLHAIAKSSESAHYSYPTGIEAEAERVDR
jgi:hypothetical protein